MAKRKPILTSKKTRYVRPTVIILGDGETEESYINRLKELDFFENVHLKYEKGNELNFETKIKEHATNKNVIVIIDVDNAASNSPKYNEIKRLVETKKYKGRVFFNNYAFELWLLNHIDYFSTPITDKSQYDSSMNDIFGVESWSRYKNQRNRKKIMDMINKDSVEEAVTNIKRLDKKNPFENPSSNMDDCINKIKKIK
jgi:hypothetical protein